MDPKRFLLLSYSLPSADIAWSIKKEGHEIKVFVEDEEERPVGDGFFEKVDDWKGHVDWADVIIIDNIWLGEEADRLRAAGKPVVGGSRYTDRLEDDRGFAKQELERAGITIIPSHDFSSFEEASRFVKAHPGRYVIKPNGDAQFTKDLLFVGEEEDGSDVVQVLRDYDATLKEKFTSFQLQKRVMGVEVAVGAFFNGKEFLTPINVNFEHKKLFVGALGPNTGEMGTSMFWSKPNRLFNATLKKMEPALAQHGYVGYIDINCIVNGHGIYPLEFTSRFGYPTISIQQEGLKIGLGELLFRLAKGERFALPTKQGFQVGVLIAVPPFPFDDKATFNSKSKDKIIRFKKPNYEGVHIENVRLRGGEWRVSGTSGEVLVVCGSGLTMTEARKQAYARIKNINIPYMYYRTDIGARWVEESDRLYAWGYLGGG